MPFREPIDPTNKAGFAFWDVIERALNSPAGKNIADILSAAGDATQGVPGNPLGPGLAVVPFMVKAARRAKILEEAGKAVSTVSKNAPWLDSLINERNVVFHKTRPFRLPSILEKKELSVLTEPRQRNPVDILADVPKNMNYSPGVSVARNPTPGTFHKVPVSLVLDAENIPKVIPTAQPGPWQKGAESFRDLSPLPIKKAPRFEYESRTKGKGIPISPKTVKSVLVYDRNKEDLGNVKKYLEDLPIKVIEISPEDLVSSRVNIPWSAKAQELLKAREEALRQRK